MKTLSKARRVLRGRVLNRLKGVRVDHWAQIGQITLSRPQRGTTLKIGERARLYDGVSIFLDHEHASIEIGDRTYINRRSELVCQNHIKIGSDCAISWDVTISDTDYHEIIGGRARSAEVVIGDNVWIASGVRILKGVTVGDGSVIAAGSLVINDIPPRSLAAGAPAVVKKNVEWRL
ncbi:MULTISPECIES: acyltransferase [Nocardiaceae]|uniref:Acetyltransferase-like isoleucine patch superfamily enzyme n=1 Tax=Rhodococcoides corynebacterioides TaxID=53972 RepID=A0ABS2KZ89_9NOCA|nr:MULTISPECIES: acyltransferase [Rhodococcus]MBM7417242.1 acetyltransferase-like isoleucine patch superfamily enzyme [Rhodococcus corynebacterioides]MBP1115495.1 acetyltransferase-like isoleucine patch superfamily enzyme [Rhodococcus sp. PvP016]